MSSQPSASNSPQAANTVGSTPAKITDTVEETCAPPVWLRSYHIRTMLSYLHLKQTTSSTNEEDKARD
jgi:hypothetical protein